MSSGEMLNEILRNERLTGGLGDAEARMLVEWLVEGFERLEAQAATEEALRHSAADLCRRGRAVSRFVCLWCCRRQRAAAIQLAGSERLGWPLPTDRDIDPCDLMAIIFDWERQNAPAPARAHFATDIGESRRKAA